MPDTPREVSRSDGRATGMVMTTYNRPFFFVPMLLQDQRSHASRVDGGCPARSQGPPLKTMGYCRSTQQLLLARKGTPMCHGASLNVNEPVQQGHTEQSGARSLGFFLAESSLPSSYSCRRPSWLVHAAPRPALHQTHPRIYNDIDLYTHLQSQSPFARTGTQQTPPCDPHLADPRPIGE